MWCGHPTQPLKGRGEDISSLARYGMQRFGEESKTDSQMYPAGRKPVCLSFFGLGPGLKERSRLRKHDAL
jgi:hypothetical protein